MKNWTEQFGADARERMKRDEAFLAECGIAPVTGIEQELYIVKDGKHIPMDEKEATKQFRDSPFVEFVHDEKNGKDKYEVIMGVGNNGREKKRPNASLAPSVMVRAHNSLRKIMDKTADANGTTIDLDGSSVDASGGLQCNISLWDKTTGKPLFCGNAPVNKHVSAANEFAMECGISLLETQKALAALMVTSPKALGRIRDTSQRYAPHLFGLAYAKQPPYSLCLRTTRNLAQDRPSNDVPLYFENRLPGGAEDSSLAMMVTLAGMVRGVKKYMNDNGIETPEEMKAHIASPYFNYAHPTPIVVDGIEAIPSSLPAMLEATQKSILAKEIMGDKFHTDFCTAYKREAFGQGTGASAAR